MEDITNAYIFLLNNPNVTGVYNAGFENISIMDIAKLVTKHLPVEITTVPSNDPRSYRVNSDKLLKTGFKPTKTVEDAIQEIIHKFNAGLLKDEDRYYNLKWMQAGNLQND
jgi:nucleoside-diphosphate-sugar epimerase